MHAGERGARAGIKNPTLQLGNLSLRGFPACTSRSFHMWLEAYVCPHLPSPPPPSPTVHLSPRRLCHLLPSKCPPCSTLGLHTCCVICLKQMALAVSSACLPPGLCLADHYRSSSAHEVPTRYVCVCACVWATGHRVHKAKTIRLRFCFSSAGVSLPPSGLKCPFPAGRKLQIPHTV